MKPGRQTSAVKTSSIEKALTIIDCFKEHHPEWSLAQLSKLLDMPKSSLVGLLKSLQRNGYIERVPRTNNYKLGLKILEISYHVQQSLPIIQYAAPILDELQKKTGQNIYLTTHKDGRLLYLSSVHSPNRSVKTSITGKTVPLHATSAGKVMMANMTKSQLTEIIRCHGLVASTSNTITDEVHLKTELAKIRRQGYAVDNEEETFGVRCIGVCIRNEKGIPVGAISISGSVIQVTDDLLIEYAQLLGNAVIMFATWTGLFPYKFLDITYES